MWHAGDVHVWQLEIPLAVVPWESVLSPEERQRAVQFRSADAYRQFVAGRYALRHVLARYTGMVANRVPLAHDARGRPLLDGDTTIDFNLSHSHDRLLIVLGNRVQVGVDIEWPRSLDGMDGVVDRYFSAAERAVYRQLAGTTRERWFYRIWTRKEAVLKAMGTGLSDLQRDLDVASVEGLGLAMHRWFARRHRPPGAFQLLDLPQTDSYLAALMVIGKTRALGTYAVDIGIITSLACTRQQPQ